MSEVGSDDGTNRNNQQEVRVVGVERKSTEGTATFRIVSTDDDTSGLGQPSGDMGVINDEELYDRSDNQDSYDFSWHVGRDTDGDDFILSGQHDVWDTASHFDGLGAESMLQAVVFIEDAYHYRSMQHKTGSRHLWVYRWFHSSPVIIFRYAVIALLHLLAFVEYPSSLTLTSDPRSRGERTTLPCWLTQFTEFLCLLLLLLDNSARMYMLGCYYFIRHKWDMGAVLFICVSLVDWSVSSGMGCLELIRFRRLLRPYFLLQNSSLMKKIVNCLRRTLPEVMSILLLLALHLYVFTLFGMLLFPVHEVKLDNITVAGSSDITLENGVGSSSSDTVVANEGGSYFRSLLDSLISLLVLLTAANNPDVTMPAYNRNRFAAMFFILYLVIGLYCFMNMLLAVIYNQFRGYFLNSMQGSLLRRRLGVRGAFEVLRRNKTSIQDGRNSTQPVIGLGVGGGVIRALVDKCYLPKHVKIALLEELSGQEDTMISVTQFQELFWCLDRNAVRKQTPGIRWLSHPKLRLVQQVFVHKYFNFFGIGVAFINLIIISVQLGAKYDSSFRESHSTLRIVNFTFAIYYLLEQLIKFWAFGWRRYLSDKGNIYDAVITSALIIGEIVSAILFGIPYFPKSKEIIMQSGSSVMWNILRMVNILIMARLLKIIPHVKAMSIVAMVLIDLMKNMKSFAGILVVIVYAFAILGMELFHGAIMYKADYSNRTFACGSYEQLDYWANNFDDFFASIIVLWDVMVVNNWQVFLEVFKNKVSPWSYLYFLAWWLLSVILVLNLFTALIMENFIMKWDRGNQVKEAVVGSSSTYDGLTVSVQLNTVHNMFRDLLHEPEDNELLKVLHTHRYLKLEC